MKKNYLISILIALLACLQNVNGQIITTFAGNGSSGYGGDGGPATAANLEYPFSLAIDDTGNIITFSKDRIRKINTSGTITTIAGIGVPGHSGDGGPATLAIIDNVCYGVFFDNAHNIYLCENDSSYIRKISTEGVITTIAGNGSNSFSGDGGPATAAGLFAPHSIVFDGAGNLYFTDRGNCRIRKISAAGTISTIAGTGVLGYGGDGGTATAADINRPAGITMDTHDNIYFADNINSRIRRIDAISGIITTIAGTGVGGYSGDGGPATLAKICWPQGITIDGLGNIYFADMVNQVVRKINTSGIIATIAGNGLPGYLGDGGPATNAKLFHPFDVVIDDTANVYIVDGDNHRIRKVSSGNHLPLFVSGHTHSLELCVDSSKPINALLSVSDADFGQNETWTLLSGPSHGIVATSYSAVSTGSILTTTGLSYTPTAGYAGTDSFRVRVDDGMSLDVTTIRVTIDPAIPGSITGPDSVCAGDTVVLNNSVAGGSWSSSSLATATIGSSGVVIGISPGTVIITYSIANSCNSAIATRAITVLSPADCAMGLSNETPPQGGLRVLPNPTNGGTIAMCISTPVDEDAVIIITNSIGEKITETSVRTNKATSLPLNVPGGVYFVIAATATEKWAAKVMVAK